MYYLFLPKEFPFLIQKTFIFRYRMFSPGDLRSLNPVLSALQINIKDKIISVRENAGADSNFILTYLMKQIFHEKNKVCLVSLHNPIVHYQNVGKKLGYDLCEALEKNELSIIDPLNDIVDCIGLEENYFQEDKDNIVKSLHLNIGKKLDDLLKTGTQQVYLIIDDLSHLADIAIEISQMINFVNYCVSLTDEERIAVILNNHVATNIDEIISNNLHYIADVHIEISALKTGRSQDVTGLISIERLSQKRQYQYKAFDRGIKTFHPGESIYHLYQ